MLYYDYKVINKKQKQPKREVTHPAGQCRGKEGRYERKIHTENVHGRL